MTKHVRDGLIIQEHSSSDLDYDTCKATRRSKQGKGKASRQNENWWCPIVGYGTVAIYLINHFTRVYNVEADSAELTNHFKEVRKYSGTNPKSSCLNTNPATRKTMNHSNGREPTRTTHSLLTQGAQQRQKTTKRRP